MRKINVKQLTKDLDGSIFKEIYQAKISHKNLIFIYILQARTSKNSEDVHTRFIFLDAFYIMLFRFACVYWYQIIHCLNTFVSMGKESNYAMQKYWSCTLAPEDQWLAESAPTNT